MLIALVDWLHILDGSMEQVIVASSIEADKSRLTFFANSAFSFTCFVELYSTCLTSNLFHVMLGCPSPTVPFDLIYPYFFRMVCKEHS